VNWGGGGEKDEGGGGVDMDDLYHWQDMEITVSNTRNHGTVAKLLYQLELQTIS